MPEIVFTTLTGRQHAAEIIEMMGSLYAPAPMDPKRFSETIDQLLVNPSKGSIVLFTQAASICGYAVIIPYWSNEFGGTLLWLDELFVLPEARNRGIAHAFFRFLTTTKPFNPVAIALEANPANEGARRLYQSLGFEDRPNLMMTRRLSP